MKAKAKVTEDNVQGEVERIGDEDERNVRSRARGRKGERCEHERG